MNTSIAPYVLPIVSWTFFFVFAALVFTDKVEINMFKGVLLIMVFLTGILSSLVLYGKGANKNK